MLATRDHKLTLPTERGDSHRRSWARPFQDSHGLSYNLDALLSLLPLPVQVLARAVVGIDVDHFVGAKGIVYDDTRKKLTREVRGRSPSS
mgnify:CR=1 FL=1